MNIRKLVVQLELLHEEAGTRLPEPGRRVAVCALVRNPFELGQPDLSAGAAWGAELGGQMVQAGLQALALPAHAVQGYGKSALVGMAGEIEHAAAIIHPTFGRAVRAAIPGAKALMPSTVKRAAPGSPLDVPLHGCIDEWSFDHFDAITVSLADGPAADELLIVLALSSAGRPAARTRAVA